MELVPILTRAESLFCRFERTVEAIDKKNNFPTPSAHQRRPAQGSSADSGEQPQQHPAVASTSGTNVGPRPVLPPGSSVDTRVISPELRDLLNKQLFWARRSENERSG